MTLVSARVRVPCSTSNLGSGFDTLGIAMERYLDARFEPGGSELDVRRTGTLAPLDEEPDRDLLVQAFVRGLGAAGAMARGVLQVHSEIPVARGLGSSAAALVAGHDLALAALQRGSDPLASFRYAYEREGHGDNAASCALGGFRAVVPGADGPRALALEISPEVGFAYAAPADGVATADARAALPLQVAHHVAVAELGYLTALLRGLAIGDPELIRVGVADELHVPYRLPLITRAFGAMDSAREAGAWAVTISGSGSGLVAMCAPDEAAVVAEAMKGVFAAGGDADRCIGFELRPDFEGIARV
jgi:homoserine kinase